MEKNKAFTSKLAVDDCRTQPQVCVRQSYTSKKGFTLIELLVVIAIIGVLASIVLVALGSARDKAKIAKAKQEVAELHKIILINYDQSGGTSPTPNEIEWGTDCSACNYDYPNITEGIVHNNNGRYDNWLGPFMSNIPADPWGHCYLMDGPVHESCPGSTMGSKICSAGPDGVLQSWNNGTESVGDDICKSFGCE